LEGWLKKTGQEKLIEDSLEGEVGEKQPYHRLLNIYTLSERGCVD
jgi:hypothetical protein